jgi:DNA-binding transcriptional MerR regulator
MRYLTTAAAAEQLGVSKQALLGWLASGKVAEPPRNKMGYRLWSASRIRHVKRLMRSGRVYQHTVINQQATAAPEVVAEFAREVAQFLGESRVSVVELLRELARVTPDLAERGQIKKLLSAQRASAPAKPSD